MSEDLKQEVLTANARLLAAIAAGDWATYSELCDPSISCFEPESRGHLVEGMPFHRFYFDLGGVNGPHNTTMSSPHVRLMADVAVVSYVRLVQKLSADGNPIVTGAEETGASGIGNRATGATYTFIVR